MGLFTKAAARLIYTSYYVDRAARKFESWRAHVVLALASEKFLDEYGQLAFGTNRAYIAGDAGFRRGLFSWEIEAIERFFPPAPARVLLGGAGGGREAFPLLERGYHVVAFDPSVPLVQSMIRNTPAEYHDALDARAGGYHDLPVLRAMDRLPALDLQKQPPFDAAICGWCSLGHIPTDAGRLDALRRCAALTHGPILISFFYQAPFTPDATAGSWLTRRAARWGSAMFAPNVGYSRLLSEEDVATLAEQAGLEVVHLEREKAWPHAVLRAKGSM